MDYDRKLSPKWSQAFTKNSRIKAFTKKAKLASVRVEFT